MSIKKLTLGGIGIIGMLTLAFLPLFQLPAIAKDATTEKIVASLTADKAFADLSSTPPTIEKPDWYYDVTVYFSVAKNGSTVGNLTEFTTLATQTLNDARGWARMGVKFVQVASGGSFTLILSQASLMPTYSSGCTADWSCNVGNKVIINDDRWMNASEAWNANGGSLRDYRHMVVNHETGHWLGHDHAFCTGAGNTAPVMQQQSIDLQGCKFNPWPLDSELWTSRF